jgi:hypothetical protein
MMRSPILNEGVSTVATDGTLAASPVDDEAVLVVTVLGLGKMGTGASFSILLHTSKEEKYVSEERMSRPVVWNKQRARC